MAISTPSRQRQRLVEVAADLGLVARGQVAERHRQAGYRGQRRGQEAALQGQRHQVLLGGGAQRLDAERDRLRQLAQDLHVLVAGHARAVDRDGHRRPARLGPRRRPRRRPRAACCPARCASQSSAATADDPAGLLAAEHPVGDPVGQPGRAAAPHRARAARARPTSGGSGRRASRGSARPGRRRSAPRRPPRPAASPSKVSAALMSSVTLASAVSMAAVRSARCRAR